MAEQDDSSKLHDARRRKALRMALVLAAIAVAIYAYGILSRL